MNAFCSSGICIGPLVTPACSSVPGVVKAGDENNETSPCFCARTSLNFPSCSGVRYDIPRTNTTNK